MKCLSVAIVSTRADLELSEHLSTTSEGSTRLDPTPAVMPATTNTTLTDILEPDEQSAVGVNTADIKQHPAHGCLRVKRSHAQAPRHRTWSVRDCVKLESV